MKIKITILSILILFITACSNKNIKSNNGITEKSCYSDRFTISIGEEYFNLFLHQIGEINGEQRVKISKLFKLIKMDNNIKWKLREMRIDIEEEETTLTGEAVIEIDGETVISSFKSKVNLEYSNEEEKLKVIPKEMRIKKLGNIDIVNFYSPVFEIKAANPFNKDVRFKMPDGSNKTILINTEVEINEEKDRIEIIMKYTN